MKSTPTFIAILFLTFLQTTFSQEYHPMLNNSSWLIYDWVSCCRPSEERIIQEGTDEVIGSYTYKKFNDPFLSGYDNNWNPITIIYLREDITERKVYKLVNGVEFLLYDFSFDLGSTINQYGNNFVVTSVDNIDVEGGTRKKITLRSVESYCGDNLTLIWIEGVGSDKHPFYPDFNMGNVCSAGGGYGIYTECSFQNGEHIYGDSNCSSLLNTNITNEIATKIDFSPNPFTTQLTIQSENEFQDVTLKLYSSVGQLVRETKNLSGKNIVITRENLKSGLYFAELQENGKIVKTTKIIIAD